MKTKIARGLCFTAAPLLLSLFAASIGSAADDFCWRDSFTRAAGTIPSDCEYSQEKQGLLCYPKCPSGYAGQGPVCWQSCPAGMVDNGVGCTKPAPKGRGAGYTWQGSDGISSDGMLARCTASNSQGCEMWGAIAYPKCEAGYANFGANICTPVCPAGFTDMGVSCLKPTQTRATLTANCPAGTNYEDGLCYSPCKTGYYGVGPVCWGTCPADKPIDCAGGCAADGSLKPGGGTNDVCARMITDQVTTVVGFIGDAVATVVTAGGYAGIKAGAKQAIKKLEKFVAKETTKEIAKAAITKMAKETGTYLKDQAQAKLEDMIAQAGQNALALSIDPNAETEVPDFEWTDLDPTGLASIVNAYNHPKCAAPVGAGKLPAYALAPLSPIIPVPAEKRGVWKLVDGKARDIAVTTGGTAIGIGTEGVAGTYDYKIYYRRPQDGSWTLTTGSASQVAAGAKTVVVKTFKRQIFRSTNLGQSWEVLPGVADDVAVDSMDNIFVINGNTIFEMKAGESVWRALPPLNRNATAIEYTQPIAISAGGTEEVVVATKAAAYRFKPSEDLSNPWRLVANSQGTVDLALAPSGKVVFATASAVYNGTKTFEGNVTAKRIAVGGDMAWAVDPNGFVYKARY